MKFEQWMTDMKAAFVVASKWSPDDVDEYVRQSGESTWRDKYGRAECAEEVGEDEYDAMCVSQ